MSRRICSYPKAVINRPIPRNPTMKSIGKKLYFLSVGFLQEAGSASVDDLGGSKPEAEPCDLRSSLSQFPPGRTSLRPTGQRSATRTSYADARFVNTIRSSVMAAAASRPTTKITTGFGSIEAAVPIAGRPSLFFRCSLFLTRISVCWRAARHCDVALRSTVHGRRHCPS